MQLRSGKTTQVSSDIINNMRFYEQIRRGNITMTMEAYTPPNTQPGTPKYSTHVTGKKTKPIITKHSMSLRTRKPTAPVEKEGGVGGNVDSNPDSGLRSKKESEPPHFAYMISTRFAYSEPIPLSFRDWLFARLKGFITTFNRISIEDYTQRIVERSRLFMELTAVLREHIDYITSSPALAKFSHVLYKKLLSFKNEITILLNGEKLSGSCHTCNFSQEERVFLGNLRADIVSLSVITKPRLPKLSVVL